MRSLRSVVGGMVSGTPRSAMQPVEYLIWLAYRVRPLGQSNMVKRRQSEDAPAPTDGTKSGRHPLFGALKGVTRIPHGVDLTEPADPDWGKVYGDSDPVPTGQTTRPQA